MTQHVHICPVGFYAEPILCAVNVLPADKYYFLINDNDQVMTALEEVESALAGLGQTNSERVTIDPFDYDNVISAIMEIHHKELRNDPDTHLYINFTSGTNIVAGACCSISYFIGATLYYVMKEGEKARNKTDRVRIIRAARIPDLEKIKPFARDVLAKICRSPEGIGMQALSAFMQSSPQKINHHVKAFMDEGLVEKSKHGRNVVIRATDQGRIMNSWMEE